MGAAKSIIIYGGGWVNNMGNAFIQIGSQYSIKKVLPGANIHIVDSNSFIPLSPFIDRLSEKIGRTCHMPFLQKKLQKREQGAHKHQVKLTELAQIDAVVVSGVWLSAKYIHIHLQDFLSLKERKIPLIINGGGGTLYTQQEFDEVTMLLKTIEPYAIISRDGGVYDAYKDRYKNVFSGIDVGFFVNDAFPQSLPMQKTTTYCFDRSAVPKELEINNTTILAHHSHPGLRHNPFTKGRTFYSELPEDYLNLYANSKTVYSDRVHACVATLAFGNTACLMDNTPRARLFDVVEAGEVRHKSVQTNKDVLLKKKQEHLTHLQRIFQELF